MKINKRLKNGLILLTGLILTLLVSCGSLNAKKVTLTYWTWPFHKEIPAGFEKAHPEIKLNIVKLGPFDLHDKLLLALKAGAGAPDVTWILQRRFSQFAETEKLSDLTPYIKDWRSDFEEGIFDITLYNGRYYGLTMDKSPEVVLVRKDLYAKFGIDPYYDTWDDFVEQGKKFLSHGIYLFPIPYPSELNGPNYFNMFLHSREGNIYTADGKVKEENPLMIEMLQWYQDLVLKHKVGALVKYKSPEIWANFKTDQYATWPINIPEITSIKHWLPEQKGKWSVMPPPRWPEKPKALSGVWGGSCMAIPKQSKKQEAARTFIFWVGHTVEGQVAYKRDIGGLGALKAAYKDPAYLEVDPYFGVNPYDSLRPVPSYHYFDWAQTSSLLSKELDSLVLGEISAEEAFRNFVKSVKTELDR